MITEFTFASRDFNPTAGELDDQHDDYINPGVFAKALAGFLITGLAHEGYAVKARIVEDWGNWIEIQHGGGFALAVCCSNLEDLGAGKTTHRAAVVPDTPFVRKWLRKIDVQPAVAKLSAALFRILSGSDKISDLRTGP